MFATERGQSLFSQLQAEQNTELLQNGPCGDIILATVVSKVKTEL